MTGINGKRVLLGGLVAGVIIAIFEIGSELILGAEWAAQFQRLGLTRPGEGAMLLMLPAMFGVGVIGVWLYALAIPRLGAKLETTCIVGLLVWALACLIPNLTMTSLGILSPRLFGLSMLVTAVQMPTAVFIGSRLYREEGVGTVRSMNTRAA